MTSQTYWVCDKCYAGMLMERTPLDPLPPGWITVFQLNGTPNHICGQCQIARPNT